MIVNLLFDLDGTLTNPKLGIIRCIRHALEKLGEVSPPADDLLWTIGPPLKDSFEFLLNGSGLDPTEAIAIFRQRFSTIGLLENNIYDGMNELLNEQLISGKHLFIASTKPHVYIRPILDYFDISQYFESVYGSKLDGTRSIKSDLLRYVFSELQFNPDETVMIGDRIQDIDGAKSVGITSIWVDYGYGDAAERKVAIPDHVCDTIEELQDLLNSI
jgi:phosphoglycolate phosphatase